MEENWTIEQLRETGRFSEEDLRTLKQEKYNQGVLLDAIAASKSDGRFTIDEMYEGFMNLV